MLVWGGTRHGAAMPMRDGRALVVVLAKYYWPTFGGTEDAVRVHCEGMAQHYRVRVIAFRRKGEPQHAFLNGVEVRRFDVLATIRSQPLSIGYLLAALLTRAALIHFHAPNVLASLALLLRHGTPIVAIHHMDIFGRPLLRWLAQRLYRGVLRRSAALVVTSPKNHAGSADIRAKVRCLSVPLGVDPLTHAIGDAARAAAARWRQSLAGDAPLVGFVGRHARYKGLDVLLRALARLPGVHAAIAGDGEYRRRAEALARELGLADRVHFLGHVSEAQKCALLSVIDVFAFPSTETTEAFGVSQLEAMLLGAPVVASDLPTGVSDVSIDGRTALTVPPGDAGALAAAIGRLLADPALRSKLATAARAHVEASFTTRHVQTRINALNRVVLAETDSGGHESTSGAAIRWRRAFR